MPNLRLPERAAGWLSDRRRETLVAEELAEGPRSGPFYQSATNESRSVCGLACPCTPLVR
jgi:hypothetical protein